MTLTDDLHPSHSWPDLCASITSTSTDTATTAPPRIYNQQRHCNTSCRSQTTTIESPLFTPSPPPHRPESLQTLEELAAPTPVLQEEDPATETECMLQYGRILCCHQIYHKLYRKAIPFFFCLQAPDFEAVTIQSPWSTVYCVLLLLECASVSPSWHPQKMRFPHTYMTKVNETRQRHQSRHWLVHSVRTWPGVPTECYRFHCRLSRLKPPLRFY
jgi:hypothetical protein